MAAPRDERQVTGGNVTGSGTGDGAGTPSVRLAATTTGRRRRGGRHRAPRRGLRIWLVLILATASVSIIGATAPLSAHTSTAGAAAPCASDGNGGCLIVLPCAPGQTACPTVDVTPNTNLADGQYVFVSAKNFDPTGSIRVALCSAKGSTTDPQCLNGNWESQALQPTSVPVTNSPSTQNLTSLSYPVFSDPAGQGNNVIPSYDITNTTRGGPGFNCDNTANPCEVIVTAEAGQGAGVGAGPPVSDANSAIVPLNYASLAAGCPSTDPQVQVDSAFSLEHFIPAAVEATCTAPSSGVVALSTATDDASVVGDYASGGAAVSFVDNASDPAQLAQLLGKSYAYIPIALSGTTESFLAGESNQGQNFPISTYNLTPNMVAGLITSLYQIPQGSYTQPPKPKYTLSDNLVSALAAAGVTCAKLAGCPSTKSKTKQFLFMQKYDAFDVLNPVPAGDVGVTSFGSFNSNVASGSSYQATKWLCTAPNAPFKASVAEVGSPTPQSVTLTDPNAAPNTLVTAPLGSSIWPPYPNATWVYPNCQGYSTFPALSATANNYGPAQSPAFQAKAMRSWCYGGTVLPQPQNPQQPCASWGLMDTSEAAFYGLSAASLENASGAFVAPTISSLEEAASTAFTACGNNDLSCPAGTYATNYANSDPAAYPMPNITYAVVPTTTLPYDQAQAITHLLTNLVTFSHGTSVPAGYAPLPDAIYHAALADITKDISSGPAPVTPTTTTTTAPTGQSTTTTSSPDTGSSGTTADTTGQSGALPLTASGNSGTTGDTSGSGGGGGSGSSPVAAPPSSLPSDFLLVGLSATTRFLLPAIVVLALGSLLGGLLLLFGPGAAARRRRGGTGGPA